jgi:hypothetical protein
MSTVNHSGLVWRKSSRSGSHVNDNCVEVAFSGRTAAIRDSKNPTAGALCVPADSFAALLRHT